jgi:hypothetical protein
MINEYQIDDSVLKNYNKVVEEYSHNISNLRFYKEYLRYFFIDKEVEVPTELKNDFDWDLLVKLIMGSFSSNYSIKEVDDKIRILMSVSGGEINIEKEISSLFSFQILRLFEILINEQIKLQILIEEDASESKSIIRQRSQRINYRYKVDTENGEENISKLKATIKNLEDLMKLKKETARVFISHSSIDKPFAESLKGKLENEGILTWFDSKDLDIGDIVSEKISEGIMESSFFLMIISENSIKSKWVKYELDEAYDLHINKGKRILPCVYGNFSNEDIPSRLRKHLYADFRDDENRAFELVKRSIIRYSEIE